MPAHTIRHFMNLVENAAPSPAERQLPKMLYHGTTAENARDIVASGMSAPSYWGSRTMASYYAEVAMEDGEDGAIIALPLAHFDLSELDADRRSLQEPVPDAISKKYRSLAKSDTPWIACFGKVESLLYRKSMIVSSDAIEVIPFVKKEMSKAQRSTFDGLVQRETMGILSDDQRDTLAWMRRTLKQNPWD